MKLKEFKPSAESAINQKSGISFEIGEKVKVCDGPFASFSGLIEELMKKSLDSRFQFHICRPTGRFRI